MLKYKKKNPVNYQIYATYRDTQAWVNSVDLDQTPQNIISELRLYYLLFT